MPESITSAALPEGIKYSIGSQFSRLRNLLQKYLVYYLQRREKYTRSHLKDLTAFRGPGDHTDTSPYNRDLYSSGSQNIAKGPEKNQDLIQFKVYLAITVDSS